VLAYVDFKTPERLENMDSIFLLSRPLPCQRCTARSLPFTNAIKSRSDVLLIEVRPNNRDRLLSELSERIQALNRC
jgi:hypothetical protein